MAQVDLASEVIKKLISEDKSLTDAVKKSVSKFISSPSFSKVVESALKESIKDLAESTVRSQPMILNKMVLEEIKKYQAKLLGEYLISPEGKKQVMRLITDALEDSDADWIWDALYDQNMAEVMATAVLTSFKNTLGKAGIQIPEKRAKKR